MDWDWVDRIMDEWQRFMNGEEEGGIEEDPPSSVPPAVRPRASTPPRTATTRPAAPNAAPSTPVLRSRRGHHAASPRPLSSRRRLADFTNLPR
ncbi:hypothetical protein CLOP_g7989 [Closterium sp. NIES-67]|nr:hypothetical protein CLOP_g7989 [Closterium sp. NIES-67]